MKSVLSLPPVLQTVWTAAYAAAYNAELVDNYRRDLPDSIVAASNCADDAAWEAVRRANGGEMPEEESTLSEPTEKEMVEVLAPIVAKSRHGEAWNRLDAYVQAAHINDIAAQLRTGDSTIARIAIASWKAARAWGRK